MAKYIRLKTNRRTLRKRRKYYRKKRGSKTNTRTNTQMVKNPTPLPNKFKANLRYCEMALNINPGVAGAADAYVFSANGLYDPNITGVGHQPTGFDQLMLIYDHYTVIGAKISIFANNLDATYSQFILCNVQDNATPSTDLRVPIENGQCTYRLLSRADGGSPTGSIVKKCNPAKFLGRSKPMSDSELKGSVSANPEEQVYFVVYSAPIQGTDTGAVSVSVTIDYTVIFHEPKQLDLS